ncbi:MAG: hypothetical protein OEX02_16475, partial [Cyclobacteriaceae bacterium]|nr:hypothetical protein [Cyclobacteriaceae bacterium]
MEKATRSTKVIPIENPKTAENKNTPVLNTEKNLITEPDSGQEPPQTIEEVIQEVKDQSPWVVKGSYETEIKKLQVELVRMQRWVEERGKRIMIIYEGRDASGKGGAIKRFIEHLNPRAMRVVALPKPTDVEKGQWYFQRYVTQLPNPGEIVFFDRSWYNRAVVEPVNGFCTDKQYKQFMRQVPEFEHMLFEDGIILIKFWFSVSKEIQLYRFNSRKENPLKNWKHSDVDAQAQDLWAEYTKFK